MKKIVIIGPFPPPVFGMAVSTQHAAERFRQEGLAVRCIDTSPASLKLRSRVMKFAHLRNHTRELVAAANEGFGVAWLALSGGWGKLHDLVLVAAARRLSMQIIISHHSWAYLRYKDVLLQKIIASAGDNQVHRVLCREMATRLKSLYRPPAVIAVSNLAFDPSPRKIKKLDQTRPAVKSLGFLSNIILEKGIDLALEVGKRFLARYPFGRMIVAGAPVDRRAIRLLKAECERESRIEYRGAVFGAEKRRFFEDVDVLLFPSRYSNEAEPRVVYEAIEAGVAVLASTVGCLGRSFGGAVLASSVQCYVEQAFQMLEYWMDHPQEYYDHVTYANRYLHAAWERAQKDFSMLVDAIGS